MLAVYLIRQAKTALVPGTFVTSDGLSSFGSVADAGRFYIGRCSGQNLWAKRAQAVCKQKNSHPEVAIFLLSACLAKTFGGP